MMQHLLTKLLSWVGKCFPSVPRLFGLKILTYGYSDITPNKAHKYIPEGWTSGSKVSWHIKNETHTPQTVTIKFNCDQEQDAYIQVYPVYPIVGELDNRWHDAVSYGHEKFIPDQNQKHRTVTLPPQIYVKVDYFSAFEPHPFLRNALALQIKPDDPNVLVIEKSYLIKQFFGLRSSLTHVLQSAAAVLLAIGLCIFALLYFLPKSILTYYTSQAS